MERNIPTDWTRTASIEKGATLLGTTINSPSVNIPHPCHCLCSSCVCLPIWYPSPHPPFHVADTDEPNVCKCMNICVVLIMMMCWLFPFLFAFCYLLVPFTIIWITSCTLDGNMSDGREEPNNLAMDWLCKWKIMSLKKSFSGAHQNAPLPPPLPLLNSRKSRLSWLVGICFWSIAFNQIIKANGWGCAPVNETTLRDGNWVGNSSFP